MPIPVIAMLVGAFFWMMIPNPKVDKPIVSDGLAHFQPVQRKMLSASVTFDEKGNSVHSEQNGPCGMDDCGKKMIDEGF